MLHVIITSSALCDALLKILHLSISLDTMDARQLHSVQREENPYALIYSPLPVGHSRSARIQG